MIRFADYTFDPDTGEVRGPAGTTRLQPQPARVLCLLVSRSGDLVTRDELKQHLWQGAAVEADQGINYCVRQIRAALHDEADDGRFIQTLPRRDYRFLVAPDPASPLSSGVKYRTSVARLAGVTAVVVAVVTGAWFALHLIREPAGGSIRIAVMPLATPNGNDWIVAENRDLTERLVAQLTNADPGRLGVVGPVTTARFAVDGVSPAEVGAALDAAYILSGGVRSGDSLLFVQVIRARDGEHIFAKRERLVGRDPEGVAAAIAQGVLAKVIQRGSL